ncbi:T9SS type A sorting domain-containing protein, partial [Porphyromonas loveana]
TNDPANAYVQNGVINVTGANGRQVSLYNMNGQLVYSGVDTTIPAQKGMYVLRVGARTFKLAI